MSIIKKNQQISRLLYLSLLSGLTGSILLAAESVKAVTIQELDFIGEGNIPGGTTFSETNVGGLSDITYSGADDTYSVISDDRNDPRFYTVDIEIDVTSGLVSPSLLDVTTLKDTSGNPIAPNTSDTEGIVQVGSDVFISSEGIFDDPLSTEASLVVDPFIKNFNGETGNENAALTIPEKFINSTPTNGVRSNTNFESLTVTPDESTLFTAVEAPLKQDQDLSFLPPPFGSAQSGLTRIIQYDEIEGTYTAGSEFLYETEPLHGLSDLLAIDESTLLVLERGNVSEPFSIKIYEVSLDEATDISSIDALGGDTTEVAAVSKDLVLDLNELLLSGELETIANYDGMTYGATLPGGESSVVLVSDNGLEGNVNNNFAVFAVETAEPEPIPEPISTFFGLGLVGLGVWKRSQK
ncbi:MAG: esterase-like activity of phytase family protein [Gomphosphaeria aponina SAG 52.96 = DSM 107014]|uniref:Esterase-like activity of phytase family protein n=1 Tax=Gomphosphaeria aponina SAG 52.96 = DSM 107014 TaxID=1521640 RepID=A0A941JMX7_9CHRO|nr:esterase-like activity of phytase family protein [Gomphosphaeria aponina SAG 52.96 = DSM 107014]